MRRSTSAGACDRQRVRPVHLGDLRLVHRALRTVEQLREPRPDEIGVERAGEVDVLVAKRNRKGAEEIGRARATTACSSSDSIGAASTRKRPRSSRNSRIACAASASAAICGACAASDSVSSSDKPLVSLISCVKNFVRRGTRCMRRMLSRRRTHDRVNIRERSRRDLPSCEQAIEATCDDRETFVMQPRGEKAKVGVQPAFEPARGRSSSRNGGSVFAPRGVCAY